MIFWNCQNKSKIKANSYDNKPINVSKISPNGKMVAYGLGNDWHMGPDGQSKWPNLLGVHKLT